MDFITYFGGRTIGHFSAPDLATAKRMNKKMYSMPVITVSVSASEEERKKAREESIANAPKTAPRAD